MCANRRVMRLDLLTIGYSLLLAGNQGVRDMPDLADTGDLKQQ